MNEYNVPDEEKRRNALWNDDEDGEAASLFGPLGMIDYMKQPTAPAPFISAGAGEVWAWGDFFLVLQKDPPAFINTKPKLAKLLPFAFPITYPYALSAYYHLAKNPHGSSFGPVAVATVEKGVHGGMMLCLFTAQGRMNFGAYKAELDADAVRQRLFDCIGPVLREAGPPRRIGVLSDAFGHPETGLPKRESRRGGWTATKRLPGCSSLLALLLLALCAWLLFG